MRYPRSLTSFNRVLGLTSGILILVIGVLAVLETVMRGVFSRPTSWSTDVSLYFLIWAAFLGSAYSFQEKGHVAVDFVREAIRRRWPIGGRTLAILGYICASAFVAVILGVSRRLIVEAIQFNQLTYANVQIPIVYLYAAMVVGSVFMLVTMICIMLDIAGGGEKYL